MPYWFFLSYARRDAKGNPYLGNFFKRLALEVGQAAGLPADVDETEIGFFDREGIEAGDEWTQTLTDALQQSKVFICLYSNGYFKSVWCGKEFEVFRSRVADYAPPPDVARPRLIIPVLWDKPGRLPDKLPDAVAGLQDTHADFGDDYAANGLSYFMKLKNEAATNEFVSNLADRIVTEANTHNLPPAASRPEMKKVQSAFHVLPPPPPDVVEAPGALPPTAPPPDIEGPDAAWYVYLAGRRADYQRVRKYLDCYGSRGGYQWQPHLPPKDGSVGAITPLAGAGQGRLTPYVLPLSRELVKHLRKAEETNTVTMLIVDPWSVKVESFRELMRDYDSYRLENCELIIIWNDNDGETPARREELRAELREAFWRNFRTAEEISRASVKSMEEFQEQLRAAVDRVQVRLKERAKPARYVPPNGGEPLPNISATSPGDAETPDKV